MKRWLSGLFGARERDTIRVEPPPQVVSTPAWWQIMDFHAGPPRSLDRVERRFRELAARAHPDRGGSAARMQALLEARAEARRQLRRDTPVAQRAAPPAHGSPGTP